MWQQKLFKQKKDGIMVMNKRYRLMLLILALLLLPAFAFADETDEVFDLPCIYRVEVSNYNNVRSDQARLGYSNYTYERWRVWAEFDISSLVGKTVTGVGLRVYNDWRGDKITTLRYCGVWPTISSAYDLNGEHTASNKYNGFSWDINNNDAWTPSEDDFFRPGSDDWDSWRRGNGKSIIEDIQDHINSGKTWFAVEFDAFNYTERPNLRFPWDLYDPSSIVIEITTSSNPDDPDTILPDNSDRPEEATDSIFVADEGGDLDTYMFRNDGTLKFNIDTTRWVRAVDANGYLEDLTTLIEKKIIAETSKLRLAVYDVDYDISSHPELIEAGIKPERDEVYFNGHILYNTYVEHLQGENDSWTIFEYDIPISYIKFPNPAADGESPTPRENLIEIKIDQYNLDDSPYWGVAVDWAELTIKAIPPVVLIHGNNSSEDYWEHGFTNVLEYIPYCRLNIPTDKITKNANSIKEEILAKAKTMGVQNIQIIAHSKGGLDTREFLSTHYPALESNDELKVHTFITLSTPHKGSSGADYIDQLQAMGKAKLANENERTKLVIFLSKNYEENQIDANHDLTTYETANFNMTNMLPGNILYYSAGADADASGNGVLERPEYIAILEEAGITLAPDFLVRKKMNAMYNTLGYYATAMVVGTGETTDLGGIEGGTPIYEIIEIKTVSFMKNDMLVTIDSAMRFSSIGEYSKNHLTVADEEVAGNVIKYLKYAE